MKKTNFTLVRPMRWAIVPLLMLLLGSYAQAQCTLACNDNVQVSASPDIGNGFSPCDVELTLDMLLEAPQSIFGAGSTCNVAYARIEVRRGNSLVFRSGQLTSDIQAAAFDGSNYLGQSLTTKVLVYDANDNVLNSCWGSIKVEDKAAPELDCFVTYPVNNLDGELDGSEGTWWRPVTFVPGSAPGSCTLSNLSNGPNWFYDAVDFTITAAGAYTFDMISQTILPGSPLGPDAFGALYAGGFDPSQPCVNLLAADDDSGTSFLGPKIALSLNLVPGNYTLVTTSYFPGGMGPYQWAIDGPVNNGNFLPILVNSNSISIDCTQDPRDVPGPRAFDNCDPAPRINLINEQTSGSSCNVVKIVRTYKATDASGNSSAECDVEVRIVQPKVKFPDDITWTCEQYAFAANVIDPSPLHPFIMGYAAQMDQFAYCCIAGLEGDDVAGVDPYDMTLLATPYWADGEDLDVTLDPRYDDNIDNPITDPNTFYCGNASAETDSRPDINNTSLLVGCVYIQQCTIPGNHIPTILDVPVYLPVDPFGNPVTGLEDADVLELTGSGVPNVDNSSCNFAVTYSDQRLEACEGLGTDGPVFKILRTWTVLNWCTGEVLTDIQVIKVLDKKAPTITFNDDDDEDGIADETERTERYGNGDGFNDQLVSNETTGSPSHPECASHGLLDVPEFDDNCTGIAEMRVFTPVGEATPVYNGGNLIGFRIPAPYLPMGIHEITYQVWDGCGNMTEARKRVEVIDGIPPVPVCREFTQVSLSSEDDGITAVGAAYFDEGSYDNCGPVYFKVRLMENTDECTGFSQEANRFDDKVHFCCDQIGDTVGVILRVYDIDPGPGTKSLTQFETTYNTNDCMIQVLVEDKVRPVCTPPADVWTDCYAIPDNVDLSDTAVLQDLFGNATLWDNCNAATQELSPNVDVDFCGVGSVTRRWRARDESGNVSLGRCEQTIMIMQVTGYEIDIPGDFEGECDGPEPDTLDYRETGCDLLAVNVEEEFFDASQLGDGACFKIVRTYKIINWCEYDGFSAPTRLPRLDINFDGKVGDGFTPNNPRSIYRGNYRLISDGDYLHFNQVNDPQSRFAASTGYYEYKQHIKVYDDTAPELTAPADLTFCGGELDEDPCTGQVDIIPDVVEECTPDDLTYEWQLDAFNDGTFDADGDGALSGRFPLGIHMVRFRVSDDCGNTSQIDIEFEVIDCKAPSPICINGLSAELMPSGMVEIWASDFDASSFDYCHPFKYRINRVTDVDGDGDITPDDYRTTLPPHDSVIVTCNDVGTLVFVQLWVSEESTDSENNDDYCVTYVEVQDNLGNCTGNRPAMISGNVKTADGDGVSDVDVQLSGNMTNTIATDNDGGFLFTNVARGHDYTVSPMKDDDVRNGVTTFDLALISKHILNSAPFTDPYKIIAADANNSKSVTTLDIVVLRKLILYVSDVLPNNTSWRFVDKDFIFPDPNDPFSVSFPEVANYNNIAADQVTNFVAVKVGDVNGNAVPNNFGGVDDRSFKGNLEFQLADEAFAAGEEVRVTFSAQELAEVMGYQFTLNFDAKTLSLVDIVSGAAGEENFGLTMVNEGVITTSWNGEAQTDEAFTLVFTSLNSGQLSDALQVSSEYTVAEAYDLNGDRMNIGINFNSGITSGTAFELYQNNPNPFRGQTVIGFNLPEAAAATLTISDVSGKVLKVVKGNFAEGYNTINLNSGEFNATGVLYYQLETAANTATKKMIIIE